jgi:hypothetical protein
MLKEEKEEAGRLRDREAEGDKDGEDKRAPLALKRATVQENQNSCDLDFPNV